MSVQVLKEGRSCIENGNNYESNGQLTKKKQNRKQIAVAKYEKRVVQNF